MKLSECWAKIKNDRKKFWKDEVRKQRVYTRLRLVVFLFLLACFVTFGLFSYLLMHHAENKIFRYLTASFVNKVGVFFINQLEELTYDHNI